MGIIVFLILQTGAQAANYYMHLGDMGELQVKVSIWGEVGAPGLYSIPEETDLTTLLSLAGGPSNDANLSQVKVVHAFPEPAVSIVDLRDYFDSGNPEGIPIMKPGDMVHVKRTAWARVKAFAHDVTEVTILLGAYITVYNLLNK
jgi:hypothetical protein